MSIENEILGHLYKRPPAPRHNSGPPLSVEDAVIAELDRVIDAQVTETEKYDAIRRAFRRLVAEGKIEDRTGWVELATAFEDTRGATCQ
jgi:hypothetical protein